MKIDDYKKIRNIGKDLAYKILNSGNNSRNDMIYAGKVLGLWDGQVMNFDSEEESDILMDFLLYERSKNRKKLIDKFYDSNVILTDEEEEVLESMVNYHSSLFEIISINIEQCFLTVIDLLDKNKTEYKIMDIGFSQTAVTGIVFYSRLLPVRKLFMTSGVSFGFDKSMKNKILSDISFSKLKRNKKLNSTDLFVLAHKRNKLYGSEISKIELN